MERNRSRGNYQYSSKNIFIVCDQYYCKEDPKATLAVWKLFHSTVREWYRTVHSTILYQHKVYNFFFLAELLLLTITFSGYVNYLSFAKEVLHGLCDLVNVLHDLNQKNRDVVVSESQLQHFQSRHVRLSAKYSIYSPLHLNLLRLG